MLPFRGDVIHARWSGEAIWSPLSTVWPAASTLEREHATGHPEPREVLLFADGEVNQLLNLWCYPFREQGGDHLRGIQFSSARKMSPSWANAGAQFSYTAQWSYGSIDRKGMPERRSPLLRAESPGQPAL